MIPTQTPKISTDPEPTTDAFPALPVPGAIRPADEVQGMFDAIAPRYDLLNHVLSGGIDATWWWRAARSLRPILHRPEARILDLCCGTGDMAMALLRHRPTGSSTTPTKPILAVDFSHQMLSIGASKFNPHNIIPIEADALRLPLPNSSMDLISAAFGFRNLVSYEDGLAELFRVLAPGGQIAILECNQPDGLVALLYNLYFKQILPRVGGLLSDRQAYTYLPTSVERFPRAPRMLQLIQQAGFHSATWTSYTFGIAGLYQAAKPRV
jgi:demethylmenaquinone methyltransferase/2-methoxy-6-polyprenyl-1,4-benzoquinol methylase